MKIYALLRLQIKLYFHFMFFVIKHYRGHILIQWGRCVSTDRVCAVWSKVIIELLRVVSSFIKLLSPLTLVRPLKRLPITYGPLGLLTRSQPSRGHSPPAVMHSLFPW